MRTFFIVSSGVGLPLAQATGTGVDGQMTYKDQDELRLPSRVAGPSQKKGVEQVISTSTVLCFSFSGKKFTQVLYNCGVSRTAPASLYEMPMGRGL